MNVADNVKTAYRGNSVTKHLTLHFPQIKLTIETKDLYSETMRLSESLMQSKSIEFVGCIASKFKISVHGLKTDIKGLKMTASICTDGTEDAPILLFQGIVDSAMKQSNKQIKEIVAYDELYTKGNIDVAGWYKSLTFPVTLRQIRDSLFTYVGITQVEIELPNDSITIQKQYDPNTLQALSVIKAICQINGAFGIINRDGNFEYRILGAIKDSGAYPSETLFPGPDVFPGLAQSSGGYNEVAATDFAFYRKVDYEEYSVKPVDKLTIRQTENDAGVTYGTGTNNYIIQGNMFTYGLSADVLSDVAGNIYPNVQGFSYFPFASQNNGLPFLECGLDAVTYMMIDYEELEARQKSRSAQSDEIPYKQQSFYILNRELSGIQALKDSYSAQGEEYQTEFVTDLQTQIDILKQSAGTDVKEYVSDYTYDKDYIDNMFSNIESGTRGLELISIPSVEDFPSNPDGNVLYAVQGIVVVE